MQYLIISRDGDQIYVYRESEEQHIRLLHNGQYDVSKLVTDPFELMDNECNMGTALDDGEWMCIPISNKE